MLHLYIKIRGLKTTTTAISYTKIFLKILIDYKRYVDQYTANEDMMVSIEKFQ